jgi:hypothetical protein
VEKCLDSGTRWFELIKHQHFQYQPLERLDSSSWLDFVGSGHGIEKILT